MRRIPCFDFKTVGVRSCVRHGIYVLILSLCLAEAHAAQTSPIIDDRLKNIELCNRSDDKSLDDRIQGCSSLINGHRKEPALVLAIAYNNRGNAYTEKGDFDRAIKDYELAIQLNPNYAKPYNNRGVVYQNKGEYDLAIKDFDKAIRLSPDYAHALANRAAAYQGKHDYERAVQDYGQAIRIDPKLIAAWNGRCWGRAILGQLLAALADCDKALGMRPDAATYDSRGLVYLKLGRYDRAIEDYSTALRLSPKLASAFYGRGLAKLRKGDDAGGETDIAVAIALNAAISNDFVRYGIE